MPIKKKKKFIGAEKTKKKFDAVEVKKVKKSASVESYVDSLDLNSLWEDFAHSFNDNGTPKYKTAWSFIQKQTKIDKERDILYWLIGPTVELESGQTPKYSLDQYDWVAKRERGFWYSSKNIESIKHDIANKASAYESVRQAGKMNIDTIAMLNSLLKQLDTEFGGRLFLANLTSKENAMRATLYINLVEKITTISNAAQIMYARTQGLDLERLDEFFKMFGSSMGRTAATLMGQSAEIEDGGSNHLKKHFNAVVDMVMTKANEYDMQLPDNLAQAIEESSSPKKKSKVN